MVAEEGRGAVALAITDLGILPHLLLALRTRLVGEVHVEVLDLHSELALDHIGVGSELSDCWLRR